MNKGIQTDAVTQRRKIRALERRNQSPMIVGLKLPGTPKEFEEYSRAVDESIKYFKHMDEGTHPIPWKHRW